MGRTPAAVLIERWTVTNVSILMGMTASGSMRISELSEASGVPIATLKYYLREGLLMPGEATGRTRATYDSGHLERVRLIRALLDAGGIGIAGVRRVLAALASPPDDRWELLGAAQRALPLPVEPVAVSGEALALLEAMGWLPFSEGNEAMRGALSAAIANSRAAGLSTDPSVLARYAHAARLIAEVDIELTGEATTPAESLRSVVVGTVVTDPLILTLRRLAQQAVSGEEAVSAPTRR